MTRVGRMFAKKDILSNEHFPPVIAFSFITLSQNEQRKITVALYRKMVVEGWGSLPVVTTVWAESCCPGWPGESR